MIVIVIDVDHGPLQSVVLFILGSRGYPGPRGPLDFVMDFSLKTVPYLGGEAHSGILKGAANLEKAAMPCISHELETHPGFSLLFVGYSLGAGNLSSISPLFDIVIANFPDDGKS